MRRLPLLVTGATGHVGHAVVRALAARRPLVLLVRPGRDEGARERVARLFPGDGEASPRVRAALAAGDVEVVEGDVSEPGLGLVAAARARLAATLGGIVHLAARTDFASGDAADYRPANVDGTRHVAELALAAGCPLVHASTHAVAGDRAGTIAEDDLDVGQGFHNGYERSKLEAEVLLRGLGAERGLAAACLRLGIVLPDAPVDGIPTGSGPLVYLEHLARLEGDGRSGGVREVRIEGDPQAHLHLTPIPFVVRALVASLDRCDRAVPTYHVTPARPFPLARVVAAGNAVVRGLRVAIAPEGEPFAPDRFEAALARRCRAYRPYHFLRATCDRRRFAADLGPAAGPDGADDAWLGRVFAAHLERFRARGRGAAAPPAGPHADVARYFARFLADKTGRRLVPGLETLTADFTVSVPVAGRFRIAVDGGRLVRAGPAPAPGPARAFDYEIDGDGFLDVVAGRTRPADLFFAGRVRIRGDLFAALATATALGDFFRLHPYASSEPRA